MQPTRNVVIESPADLTVEWLTAALAVHAVVQRARSAGGEQAAGVVDYRVVQALRA